VRDNHPSWGTPTLLASGESLEVVTNGTKKIRGYDPRTGVELWSLGPNSEITVGTPVVGHGLVFVTGGYPPVQPIYAIRPGGRGDLTLPEGQKSSPQIAWSHTQGGTYIPTPIVYGDHLYTLANNGVLSCYQGKTGERIYRERVGGTVATPFTASPLAADGKLYLTSEDGDVYVVKAGPQFELLAKNPLGEVVMATPAVSEGTLYFRTLSHLLAIGEKAEAAPRQPRDDGRR
jgi:outer membrane protein assembly factor BamB